MHGDLLPSFPRSREFWQRKGSTWEGALITQELYDSQVQNRKFVPVLVSAAEEKWIPEPLRAGTHYTLTSNDEYNRLYDFLLDQAGVEPHALGELNKKVRHSGPVLDFEK